MSGTSVVYTASAEIRRTHRLIVRLQENVDAAHRLAAESRKSKLSKAARRLLVRHTGSVFRAQEEHDTDPCPDSRTIADGPVAASTTPSSLMAHALPIELIIKILSYLSPRELAIAQMTCRLMRDVVNNTSSLQYTIECHLTCTIENSTASALSSSAERVAQLKAWIQAVRFPDYQLVYCHPVQNAEDRAHDWGIHGSVVWHRTAHEVEFFVPSATKKASAMRWKIRLPPVGGAKNIYYDSSDDLLVLARCWAHDTKITLFFLQASTGNAHPDASMQSWNVPMSTRFLRFYPRVSIRNGLVSVNYYTNWADGSNEYGFQILDWKKGEAILSIYSDMLKHGLLTMSFVAHDLLASLVYTTEGQLAIAVLPWRNLPPWYHSFMDVWRMCTIFHLPATAPKWRYTCPDDHWSEAFSPSRIDWNPVPTNPNYTQTHFRPDSAHSLVSFKLAFAKSSRGDYRCGREPQILVHSQTLAAYSTSYDREPAGRDSPRVVPWSEWALRSRIVSFYVPPHVYGSKLFYEETFKSASGIVTEDYGSIESMLRDVTSIHPDLANNHPSFAIPKPSTNQSSQAQVFRTGKLSFLCPAVFWGS